MVYVAGDYSVAGAVHGLFCFDIFCKLSPLRDFVTFDYEAIVLFAMILNLLVNRLKRYRCHV